MMFNTPPGNNSKRLGRDFLPDVKKDDGEDDNDTLIQVSSDGCGADQNHPRHPSGGSLHHLAHGSEDTNNLKSLSDRRFDSFKTWSGKLERQISILQGKPLESSPEYSAHRLNIEQDGIPADRFFEALEGPELEVLRPSEDIVLPADKKWPFLLRFPISAFGISLGISIQAVLWKILATAASTKFLHISIDVGIVLWGISLALAIVIYSIYLLKVILYFEAVRREYYHPVRVNFFFTPWIGLLLLAMGIPPSLMKYLHQPVWYILMAPILLLELKIYGQWMLGGKRRLSKVANPTTQLSVVGNFVGAFLGAMMGLKQGPLFFFAVGLAHFIVLFVTLYQRLPTNETLPKDLHPVFFLFIAVPNIGAAAWAKIQGSYDDASRIGYFLALFLYISLASRVNLLRGLKFSMVWWAYTVPLTSAAIATVGYSDAVTNWVTRSLAVVFTVVSALTVILVLVRTMVHAFVLRDLFPNDIAIAISTEQSIKRHPPSSNDVYPVQDDEAESRLKHATMPNSDDVETGLS